MWKNNKQIIRSEMFLLLVQIKIKILIIKQAERKCHRFMKKIYFRCCCCLFTSNQCLFVSLSDLYTMCTGDTQSEITRKTQFSWLQKDLCDGCFSLTNLSEQDIPSCFNCCWQFGFGCLRCCWRHWIINTSEQTIYSKIHCLIWLLRLLGVVSTVTAFTNGEWSWNLKA